MPREDADKYHAHAERDGLIIGAEVLTSDQAHKKFSANVNRCCIVVEVAFYPVKDKPVDVLLDDFTLRPEGTDIAARAMSPQVVAARLDKKPEATSRVSTTESAGVGYESGTYIDPVTGRPVKYHGVTTETGVGVGVDPSGTQSSGATAIVPTSKPNSPTRPCPKGPPPNPWQAICISRHRSGRKRKLRSSLLTSSKIRPSCSRCNKFRTCPSCECCMQRRAKAQRLHGLTSRC